MMEIEIRLKSLSKAKAREIFDRLYDALKQYRHSEYEAFIELSQKGLCIAV